MHKYETPSIPSYTQSLCRKEKENILAIHRPPGCQDVMHPGIAQHNQTLQSTQNGTTSQMMYLPVRDEKEIGRAI